MISWIHELKLGKNGCTKKRAKYVIGCWLLVAGFKTPSSMEHTFYVIMNII